MKKVLFITLCLVCGLAAQAQFRVYAHKGKVEYRAKEANGYTPWKAVQDGLELSSIDSLRIPKKGSVRIEHILKGLAFNSCSTGKTRVFELVLEAQKENTRRTLARLNKEIDTGKQRENIYTMNAVGGVERGSESSKEFEQLVEQFAWIGAQAVSGKQSPKEEGLRFTKNKVGDELDFIYENRTDKNYHMNVLHVNKRTNIASLCYVINPNISYGTCPITPGGCCSCSNKDLFFPNTENDVYVLVATEIPYDTYELDNALLQHPINKAKGANIDVKYIW